MQTDHRTAARLHALRRRMVPGGIAARSLRGHKELLLVLWPVRLAAMNFRLRGTHRQAVDPALLPIGFRKVSCRSWPPRDRSPIRGQRRRDEPT